jgi:hypothetical protein
LNRTGSQWSSGMGESVGISEGSARSGRGFAVAANAVVFARNKTARLR